MSSAVSHYRTDTLSCYVGKAMHPEITWTRQKSGQHNTREKIVNNISTLSEWSNLTLHHEISNERWIYKCDDDDAIIFCEYEVSGNNVTKRLPSLYTDDDNITPTVGHPMPLTSVNQISPNTTSKEIVLEPTTELDRNTEQIPTPGLSNREIITILVTIILVVLVTIIGLVLFLFREKIVQFYYSCISRWRRWRDKATDPAIPSRVVLDDGTDSHDSEQDSLMNPNDSLVCCLQSNFVKVYQQSSVGNSSVIQNN